jgi:hypothetical protein
MHVEKPTSDHIFPKSWYPDSTPPNLEKWQMPSCEDCNRKYGKLEDDLLQRFSLCVDNRALESLGLGTRLVKALDPSRGRDSRDTEIRVRRAAKLLGQQHVPTGDKPIVQMSNAPSGVAIPVKVRDLELLGEKIMRGMIYLHMGLTVGDEFDLFCNAFPRPHPTFDALLASKGALHQNGPGIRIRWIKPGATPLGCTFMIEVFGVYPLRGGVLPKDYPPHTQTVACAS